MVVYGTRPEAIKVAPVIKALEKSPTLFPITVITAQHREMLDQVNEVFGITPDVDLDLMQPGQSLNQIAARVIAGLDTVYEEHRPAAVLVQGDTTTVKAAAIAAFNREIPVVHLEAGLRSGDLASPFPEEANRKLVSQIAALHLAPTEQARRNLLRDGVDDATITVTGNTVIDALRWAVKVPARYHDPALKALERSSQPMLLLTSHRRENLGEPMQRIGRAVAQLAHARPDLLVVWPAHRNPAVRSAIGPEVAGCANVIVTEPVGYDEFSHLINRSHVVLTDSGGLQEEAPSLGKPVLVLRENTERPEAVAAGTARLVGTDTQRIVSEVSRLLDDASAYAAMSEAVSPYGDGHAAEYGVAAMEALVADTTESPRSAQGQTLDSAGGAQ